jgi:hypothetical protein
MGRHLKTVLEISRRTSRTNHQLEEINLAANNEIKEKDRGDIQANYYFIQLLQFF